MAICPHCGTQSPDNYAQCPNCGAGLMQQQAAPSPYGYAAPSVAAEAPPTSILGWFGWHVLCWILPLIGTIIMLCTVKDQSAKNYAKVMLILQIISIVLIIALIGLIVGALRSIAGAF